MAGCIEAQERPQPVWNTAVVEKKKDRWQGRQDWRQDGQSGRVQEISPKLQGTVWFQIRLTPIWLWNTKQTVNRMIV